MTHPLQLIKRYFESKGITLATKKDAYVFLVTEVGELGDAIMRQENGWVRNDPTKEVDIADEAADVFMMLWALADSYHVDLDQALKNKLERKLNGHHD